MRKSVVVGLGLWLLAVASVAAIASLAIDSASRKVTAAPVSSPAAGLTASNSSELPVTTTQTVGPTQAPPSATPSRPRASTADETQSAKGASHAQDNVHFGSLATDGGRVKAGCVQERASLDGGYARPEPGWTVRARVYGGKVWVLFGQQERVISVMAQCFDGKPAFTQEQRSLAEGAPFPSPGQSIMEASPTPSTWSGKPLHQPSVPPTAAARPVQPLITTPGTPDTSLTPPVTSSASAVDPLASSTPSPSSSAVDADQVAAYVATQDGMCSNAGWSTDWCHRWSALSDSQRSDLVERWLAAGAGQDGLDGRDRVRS